MAFYYVAVSFKATDGIREISFLTEETLQARSAAEALAMLLRKTEAERALPGTLQTLVRAL